MKKVIGLALLVAGVAGAYGSLSSVMESRGKVAKARDAVVLLDDARKAQEFEGKLVLATGIATPEAPLTDRYLKISRNVLKLGRESQIFQWNAERQGKTWVYRTKWASEPQPSAADGSTQNYGDVLLSDTVLENQKVALVSDKGRLATLSPEYMRFIGTAEAPPKTRITTEEYAALPPGMRDRFALVEGALVEWHDHALGQPRIGDNRTRLLAVDPYEVTVLGRMRHGMILLGDEAEGPAGGLYPGRLSKEAFFERAAGDATPWQAVAGAWGSVAAAVGATVLLSRKNEPRGSTSTGRLEQLEAEDDLSDFPDDYDDLELGLELDDDGPDFEAFGVDTEDFDEDEELVPAPAKNKPGDAGQKIQMKFGR